MRKVGAKFYAHKVTPPQGLAGVVVLGLAWKTGARLNAVRIGEAP